MTKIPTPDPTQELARRTAEKLMKDGAYGPGDQAIARWSGFILSALQESRAADARKIEELARDSARLDAIRQELHNEGLPGDDVEAVRELKTTTHSIELKIESATHFLKQALASDGACGISRHSVEAALAALSQP